MRKCEKGQITTSSSWFDSRSSEQKKVYSSMRVGFEISPNEKFALILRQRLDNPGIATVISNKIVILLLINKYIPKICDFQIWLMNRELFVRIILLCNWRVSCNIHSLSIKMRMVKWLHQQTTHCFEGRRFWFYLLVSIGKESICQCGRITWFKCNSIMMCLENTKCAWRSFGWCAPNWRCSAKT